MLAVSLTTVRKFCTGTQSGPFCQATASGTGSSGQPFIEGVRLWQPLHAYLYTCVVELWQHGQCIDTYEQPFSVRTIAVKDGKFLISGKPFYFKGFGKHEDSHIHERGLDEVLNLQRRLAEEEMHHGSRERFN